MTLPPPPRRLHLIARLPLVQAPMAGSQGLRLARAVTEAGGIGSLPAAMLDPSALEAALGAWAGGPLNVNFFCHRAPQPAPERTRRWRARLAGYRTEFALPTPEGEPQATRHPFDAAMAEVLAAHRPSIVSFHFGLPAPELLARVRATGAQVWSSATTLDEARWLLDQGVDALIVQGLEAGGHRGHFLRPDDDLSGQAPLRELLPAVLAMAEARPVIAAGGLATPEAVAEVLALGATAAQVGSAYLRCDEADSSALHRAALAAGSEGSTALTNLFSGRPARGQLNRLMREQGPICPDAPAFPLATADLAPLRAAAEAQGRSDFSPLWSGTRGHLARSAGAAEITRWLAGAD